MKTDVYVYLDELDQLNTQHEFVKVEKAYDSIALVFDDSKRDDVRIQISNDLSSYCMAMGRSGVIATYQIGYNDYDKFYLRWFDSSEKKESKRMKTYHKGEQGYKDIRNLFVAAGYEDYVGLFERINKEFSNKLNEA